jgi:hypothetical protein
MRDEGLTLVSGEANAERIDARMNNITTFRILHDAESVRFEAAAAGARWNEGESREELFAHPVVEGALDYVRHLIAIRVARCKPIAAENPIVFQCNDTPADGRSVGWESGRGWKHLRLVPDLYYFRARGYEDFTPTLPAWVDRADCIGWRGASTGLPNFTVEDLDRLPRYRLARIAAELGELADIGLSSVVQPPSEEERQRVIARLERENMLRGFVPFEQFGQLRYVVDIDGNANAWNLMEKLRLGACLLKVRSDWMQWFEPRLTAWRHYVPVRQDLSDFTAKFDWCRQHPRLAEEIAREGQAFAMRMRFDEEMALAAATAFG